MILILFHCFFEFCLSFLNFLHRKLQRDGWVCFFSLILFVGTWIETNAQQMNLSLCKRVFCGISEYVSIHKLLCKFFKFANFRNKYEIAFWLFTVACVLRPCRKWVQQQQYFINVGSTSTGHITLSSHIHNRILRAPLRGIYGWISVMYWARFVSSRCICILVSEKQFWFMIRLSSEFLI